LDACFIFLSPNKLLNSRLYSKCLDLGFLSLIIYNLIYTLRLKVNIFITNDILFAEDMSHSLIQLSPF
jgi:hypothetical protein